MWEDLLDSVDAVLFDLDGTVIDSMWIWKQIDIDYFNMFNKEFPEDYQAKIEGMSVYETARYSRQTYGFEQSIEEMINTWNEMAFKQYSENVVLKESVIDFLHYLREKGIKMAIATSNSEILCNEVLEKRGIKDYFDSIITGDNCIVGKPAPDVYLQSAENLGVAPERCLVFEDLSNGIKAGNSAGMRTVAVWDDYSSKSWDEKRQEADYSIMDYKEIIDEIYQ